MTRVSGLVFSVIFSIAVAFAVPPSKSAITHKSAVASTHAAKPAISFHAAAHHGSIGTVKPPARPVAQLRAVSTRLAYLRPRNSGTLNVRTVRGRRLAAHPAVPSFQTHPDEDRYRQIQQALADKGYFRGEVNGQWGSDSVNALQKFQNDKGLPDIYSDGKINALSLIQLGLGPKHGTRTGDAVPTPPLPEAPETLAPAGTSSSVSSLPPAPSK
ncbi:MAG: peptidoglycan-binding domain-containing protein [Bryobacteraceae bacterium]